MRFHVWLLKRCRHILFYAHGKDPLFLHLLFPKFGPKWMTFFHVEWKQIKESEHLVNIEIEIGDRISIPAGCEAMLNMFKVNNKGTKIKSLASTIKIPE